VGGLLISRSQSRKSSHNSIHVLMTTAHQIAFIRSRQIKVTGWTAVRPADPHLAPVLPAASLQCGGAIKIGLASADFCLMAAIHTMMATYMIAVCIIWRLLIMTILFLAARQRYPSGGRLCLSRPRGSRENCGYSRIVANLCPIPMRFASRHAQLSYHCDIGRILWPSAGILTDGSQSAR